MIKSEKVNVYQDILYCDKCGEEMQVIGLILASCPPKYPYECPKCGNRTNENDLYPKIRYEVIEEMVEE